MGPPFGGSLTGVMSNATTCGNHSGTKPNTIPGQAEKCSASARNPVRLQPGIVFGISPEPCSDSPREPVRLRPESAELTSWDASWRQRTFVVGRFGPVG